MTHTQSVKDGGTTYTATVDDDSNLESPVTVTGGGSTVTFDGNDFAGKHLRRIRRNSVSLLKDAQTGPTKLTGYITEARGKSVDRWDGNEIRTNSRIYLDLGEYCQFGCQVIKAVKDGNNPWTPWGPQNIMQKHVVVTLGKCLAYSHSGIGLARSSNEGRIQGGVGIALNVTIRQVNGSADIVSVCHYAGGEVQGKFKDEYGDKKDLEKRVGIAKSIVH
jgi:hypothetical protein